MFPKLDVLNTLHQTGTLLIVRLDSAEEAEKVAEAAIDGGIRAVELTLSIPGALRVVERLAERHRHEGVVVGAGTVMDGHAAYASIQAGAQLLVSPNVNADMIATASRYQAVAMSGAFTPTEIVTAAELGADIVKIFPAELAGPAYVKSVLAPLAGIPLAPAGGATVDNVGEWFDAGVAAVGVGSFITKAARATGDYADVTRAAERFLAAVNDARS